jgi:hypothetical protein
MIPEASYHKPMDLTTAFSWGWAVLLLAGVSLEAAALRRPEGGLSLSSQVWKVLSLADRVHPALGWTGRILILGGAAWLGLHFAFQI